MALAFLVVGCGTPSEDPASSPGTDPSATAGGDAPTVGSFVGSVERLTPEFDSLVSPDARIEVLAEGHGWTEGPVWVQELGGLLYSDIPANTIYLHRDGEGARPWIAPSEAHPRGSGGSNGLALDASGRLLLAQHGDRRIARLEADWEAVGSAASGIRFQGLAREVDGRRLNSPNDLVQGPAGDLYFTDPPYGLAGGDDDPVKALDMNGVYRLRSDGVLELVDGRLKRPNGIALSPDGSTLYVASSHEDERVVVAYPVGPDGSVGPRRRFADSWGDGMAVDQEGNVYVAEPTQGVYVFDPDGRHIGSILTGQRTSNVAWGDDGSTLYITADSYLMRVRLITTGAGLGG